ncbi:hypothetical protein [Streptomyces sp. NPDC059874]|uniref:hypothetical protein n=1 Tax=Streptomyces sp. NPDC059874 TaxID=3346983 RepID=UPI003647B64A
MVKEIRGGTPDGEGLARPAAEQYGVDPPVECQVRPVAAGVSAGAIGDALALVGKADRLVGRAMERFSDFEQTAGVEVAYPGDLREIQGAFLNGGDPVNFSGPWRSCGGTRRGGCSPPADSPSAL